jgi:hypothetical protein
MRPKSIKFLKENNTGWVKKDQVIDVIYDDNGDFCFLIPTPMFPNRYPKEGDYETVEQWVGEYKDKYWEIIY